MLVKKCWHNSNVASWFKLFYNTSWVKVDTTVPNAYARMTWCNSITVHKLRDLRTAFRDTHAKFNWPWISNLIYPVHIYHQRTVLSRKNWIGLVGGEYLFSIFPLELSLSFWPLIGWNIFYILLQKHEKGN